MKEALSKNIFIQIQEKDTFSFHFILSARIASNAQEFLFPPEISFYTHIK